MHDDGAKVKPHAYTGVRVHKRSRKAKCFNVLQNLESPSKVKSG